MNEEQIIQAFQRGRRRAITLGFPAFVLGGVCFYLGPTSWHSQALGWLGFLVAGAGIMTVARNMRCPVCNKIPMGVMGGGSHRGVVLNPMVCPTCGVRLSQAASTKDVRVVMEAKPARPAQSRLVSWMMLLCGIGLPVMKVPGFLMERQLDEDRGANAISFVEGQRVVRTSERGGRYYLYYDGDYRFQAAGETYHGHYHCTTCALLRTVREGDSLKVRYARADPSVNRPRDLPDDNISLLLAMLFGLALTTLGLQGVLRDRDSPSPSPN